ncbi:MAG: hypothetical protein IKK69_00230 [Firmicutes bacterium]|nr:hypothetical protein [Bacillota bacterium]
MAKKYTRKLEPIKEAEQLAAAIEDAGAGFIGLYMAEFIESFECFDTKDKKNQYMDYFYNDCFTGQGTKKDLQSKINTAIRIIESGLVLEAMEYVISADDCEGEAKDAARMLMENLASGAIALPEFHK